MMNAFRKSTIDLPKRKQLTGLQSTLSAKLIDSMLNNLSVGEIPSSIALDGWMNVRHCDVTNILILSNGSSYLYRSIENQFESTTSNWMYNHIISILNTLRERQVRIVGLVMDNASKNVRLYSLLNEHYPHLIRVPCAAHILQLCVKKILKVDGIDDLIAKVERILLLFRENSNLRLKLRRVQCNEDGVTDDGERDSTTKSKALQLIRPADTRWSSSLFAIQRLLLLKPHILYILGNLEEGYPELTDAATWEQMEQLVAILKPFPSGN
jgi:hypothetical protein